VQQKNKYSDVLYVTYDAEDAAEREVRSLLVMQIIEAVSDGVERAVDNANNLIWEHTRRVVL
jgi:hypothetical protein